MHDVFLIFSKFFFPLLAFFIFISVCSSVDASASDVFFPSGRHGKLAEQLEKMIHQFSSSKTVFSTVRMPRKVGEFIADDGRIQISTYIWEQLEFCFSFQSTMIEATINV
jgi:hypothetical protein